MYETPNLNHIWRNAIIRCGQEIAWSPEAYDRVANAIRAEDPGFLGGTEWVRKPDTDLFGALGLRPIPLQEIGIYPDAAQSGWENGGLPHFPEQ